VVGSGPFTDWVDRERERLREAASGAAWKLAHAKIAAGELTEAERVAQRALMLVPTDESPVRGFIEALAGAGDRAAALRFYERFREVLVQELEVEPAPETVAVMEAVMEAVRGRTEAVEVVSVSVRGADESRRAGNAANLSAATGRRPRWKRPAVGIALPVVLVVIGYGLMRSLWSRVDGTGEAMIANRVAIFPFTVRGDDELAYLAEGMADLFATALDGAGAIVTVDPRAVIGVVEREATGPLDPELSRHIAARLGARRYVLGDILSAGGQIRARASLYEDAGEPQASAEAVVPDEAGIFDLVDEAARQLVVADADATGDELTRIGVTTTHSLAALKAYLRAESLFRAGALMNTVSARSAMAEYRRAVAADTTFALAYFRMAVIYRSTTVPLESGGVAELARRYSDRLPRQERRLVECLAATDRADGEEAERWCREVLERDPDNADAWWLLGDALQHFGLRRGRALAEVQSAYDRAIALEPSNLYDQLLGHRAWLASVEEDAASWAEYLDRLASDQPQHPSARLIRLALDAWRGEPSALEHLIAELRTQPDPLGCYLWTTYLTWPLANREATIRALRGITSPDRSRGQRALGHVWIAHEELAAGRLGTARAELVEAQSLDLDGSVISTAYLLLSP
jgi:tetratricopeptide (TPR) repeat protein